MNHNTPLIVDVDDTILDWIGGFRNFMSKRLGRRIDGLPEGWDMSSWLSIPKEDVSLTPCETREEDTPHVIDL